MKTMQVVTQCDLMPLIDESESILDGDLMTQVAGEFTVRNGLIIDSYGNCWYRWRADGLDSWWRMFEETIDVPMGRKLVNSACDEEENLLNSNELDFTGFFRKKKSFNALKRRWWLHGWGNPNLSPLGFDSIGLTPLFAGMMQADVERIKSRRYRMLWEEKSNETTILTLEESNLPLTASKPSTSPVAKGEPYMLEIEKGWKIDGLSHFLLPAGLFVRLQESCAGLTANISDDERTSWPDLGDGFLSLAIATKKLFIAGEELFLAADDRGWIESCEAFFGSRGMSTPISVKSLDSNGGIELKYSEVPCLAITVGNIAGAWVRCEGRPVKVELRMDDEFSYISLQSRYELS